MIVNRYILHVEDDPDDALLVERALRQSSLDIRLVLVRDGVHALDYLKGDGEYKENGTPELPTFILLDWKVPRIDGLELLRRIRSDPYTRRVPVVVFTSSNEERDVVDAYVAGANCFVQKPVDFAEFSKAVISTIHFWMELNLTPPPSLSNE